MKIIEKEGLYYCEQHDVLLEREIGSLEFVCPKDGKKIKGKEIKIDENKTSIKLSKQE